MLHAYILLFISYISLHPKQLVSHNNMVRLLAICDIFSETLSDHLVFISFCIHARLIIRSFINW